jgi:hypothetical protein
MKYWLTADFSIPSRGGRVPRRLSDHVQPKRTLCRRPWSAGIGPSAFLKDVARSHRNLVEERLHQQTAAIGVSMNDLLDRLAGSVPAFVPSSRD